MSSLGRFHCRTCTKDCEGDGYGFRETRLCRKCAENLKQDLSQKLGIIVEGWDDYGIEITWQDAAMLAKKIKYDPLTRVTFITDKDRVRYGNV